MRGMPFNLQGKGAVEVAAAAAATGTLWRSTAVHPSTNGSVAIVKKEGIEPRSVLDHQRSPSPPTSTSTLSSSQGGGGGGADSAGVAAVSDNPLRRWPPSQDTITSAATADAAAAGSGGSTANGDGRREEWASELQPIPAALEIGLLGGEKCGIGMMEDWETMLSEPAPAASPGHDQSLLKWIMGEVEDPSGLKQQSHYQLLPPPLPPPAMEFGCVTAVGPRLGDPVFGFEHLGGMEAGLSASGVTPSPSCSAPAIPAGGFAAVNSNSGSALDDGRIPAMTPISGNLQGLNAPTFGNTHNPNPIFSPSSASNIPHPLSVPPGVFFQEATVDEKPHLFNPNLLLNQQQTQPPQNPSFFLPLSPYDHQQPPHPLLLPSQPKRHHPMTDPGFQIPPGAPFPESMKDPFIRRLQQAQQHQQGVEGLHALPYHNIQQMPMKPKLEGDDQQQQQALIDQLFKAAGLIEARNFVSARGILARLNHQLYSPIGKPLLRSAFYCKEALQCIVTDSSNSVLPSTSLPLPHNPAAAAAVATPLDVVLKLSAYKAFSEVSPILQFANFTCTQAILEELNGCDHIHIIDFDIGVGGQWSSFMQELAQRRCATVATTPTLKITAFASLYSSHPVELSLTMENLSHFANDLNISFEINIMSIDSFDPAKLLSMAHTDETIAVNLPVGLAYPSIPALLHLVKQLSPKIVVSVDHGCNHNELTFSRHFLHTLQSTTILLDSIDAASTNADLPNKIERYLVQPRIDNAILGRHRASNKAFPWRTLFDSAGFSSVSFSNFTETQAECLLKKLQLRGFHVEKRQQSLFLCWKQGELVSVSVWRC